MNGKIKSWSIAVLLSLVLVMAYMVAPPVLQPDSYIQTGEQTENSDLKLVEQPEGTHMVGLSYVPVDKSPQQADALIPAVVGATAVAGTVGTGFGFWKGLEVAQYLKESDVNESEGDDIVRTNVHDAAITTNGTYEGWADGIDNDLNTIEGSTLQVVNDRLINEADNLTSESETVTTAGDAADDYLWGTQSNIEETHNFHSYDLYQNQIRLLEQANYSDDAYAEVYETVEVTDDNDLNNYTSQPNPVRFELQNDIQLDTSRIVVGSGSTGSQSRDIVIDGNNNTIDLNDSPVSFSDKANVIFRNVTFDNFSNQYSRIATDADINVTVENDTDAVGGSIDFEQASGTIQYYNKSNVNLTFDGTNAEISETKYGNSRVYDVTLDASDVSSPETTVGFTNNNSTVNMTGVNISVASSYSNASEAPLQVAVPYVNNSGTYEAMDYANGSKLYIETPTSGIYDRVEPVQFQRTIDIMQQRDSRSDSVYNTVQTHAKNTWNDTIKDIADDPNLNATDYENVTEDLSLYNVDTVDVNDTDAVLSQYAGLYDSVAQPSDTRLNLSNGGTNYTDVVLFSTDLQMNMNETANASELAVNDTFNASNVSRVVAIDANSGEVHDLSGDVTIDDVRVDGSQVDAAGVQTFDLQSTDLSKQAAALQESVTVTIETVDTATDDDFVFPTIPGIGGAGSIFVYLIVVGVVIGIFSNRGRR